MILNLLVIAIVVGSAAAWASKARGFGLFSAFLALICTLAAGAVAFAAWEPLSLLILDKAAKAKFIADSAWGIGLIVPYIVALLVFRFAVDSFVGKNLDFSDLANTIGGAVFGAANGFVAAGIVVLSLSFCRLPPDVLGYQPVTDRKGSMVYEPGLWLPADRTVAMLYSHLSHGAFATDTPLATWQPRLDEQAGMFRVTYEGKSRTTLQPDEFRVLGQYEVKGSVSELMSDRFEPRAQSFVYTDGSAPSGGRLIGYVVQFESGAKDKGGSMILTPAQVRLIGTTSTGEPFAIHPFAVVAPPEAGVAGLTRFRFDAKDPFIASQGGAATAAFGLEFIVPEGAKPSQLLVKNARRPITGGSPRTFKSVAERDSAILDTSIFKSFGVGGAPAPGPASSGSSSGGATGGGGSPAGASSGGGDGPVVINIVPNTQVEGVSVIASLPFNMTLNKSNVKGLDIGANGGIAGGQSRFDKSEIENRGLGRELRVDQFEKAKKTGIIQITLALDGARSLFGRAAQSADDILQPLLVDQNGQVYEALGYVYKEGNEVEIRFTPEAPLRALSEAPNLSRGKRDQSLILVFRPTAGVLIQSFRLGPKEIARFEGGLRVP